MKFHVEMNEKEVRAMSPFLYLFNLPGGLEASEWVGKYSADYSYPERYMTGLSDLYFKYKKGINALVAGIRSLISGFKEMTGFHDDLETLVADVTPEIKIEEKRIFEDE